MLRNASTMLRTHAGLGPLAGLGTRPARNAHNKPPLTPADTRIAKPGEGGLRKRVNVIHIPRGIVAPIDTAMRPHMAYGQYGCCCVPPLGTAAATSDTRTEVGPPRTRNTRRIRRQRTAQPKLSRS